MNESAAFLWKNIQGTDFDAEKLTKLLLEEYDVDESTASNDAQTLIAKWLEAGIIE